jgi:hypothetical protein
MPKYFGDLPDAAQIPASEVASYNDLHRISRML